MGLRSVILGHAHEEVLESVRPCLEWGANFTRPHPIEVETAELPVVYFIDPAIADDPGAKQITGITLSYTFYPADAPEAVSSASESSAPVN